MSAKSKLGALIGIGLVASAIRTELKKRPRQRTWHGRVAGFIPYDFRAPSPRRVRQAFWDPKSPRLFTETVFGLGWSVNLARIAQMAGIRPGK